MLRVRQERAVHRQRHRHAHALVLGDAVADEHVLQRLLRRGDPHQEPAHITDRERVVVLHAKRAGIVQRPVADQEEHRQPVGRGDDERLEAVHPAGAAAAGERAGSDRARVLHDLELRVLAVRDDVLSVKLPVRDDLGQHVHDLGVRANRIGSDHVDVSEADRLGHGLAAGQQVLSLPYLKFLGQRHYLVSSLHYSHGVVILTKRRFRCP